MIACISFTVRLELLNAAEAKCQWYAVGWYFVEKFEKFSRLHLISSYISVNWSFLKTVARVAHWWWDVKWEAHLSRIKNSAQFFLLFLLGLRIFSSVFRHFSSLYIFLLASFFWSNEHDPNLKRLKVFLDLQLWLMLVKLQRVTRAGSNF